MYDAFIEEIDGVDNGVDAATGEKNYKVTTTVSSRISRLRPAWNEEYTTEKEIECFRLAMGIMMEELAYHLHEQVEVLLPARQIVDRVREEGSVLGIGCECHIGTYLGVGELLSVFGAHL